MTPIIEIEGPIGGPLHKKFSVTKVNLGDLPTGVHETAIGELQIKKPDEDTVIVKGPFLKRGHVQGDSSDERKYIYPKKTGVARNKVNYYDTMTVTRTENG